MPLVAETTEEQPTNPDDGAGDVLHGEFDETAQRELIAEMVGELPFPEGGWRIDPTDHPFAITIGRGDVRLTTRYDEENLGMALFSVMHEAGHGLYEAGQDPALARTPLEKPRSLGLHESQSRLWENWLARGRLPGPPAAEAAPALPRPARRRLARPARTFGQSRPALADPDRGRRGHLQPAHPDPLRAGAGDLRRQAGAVRAAGGLERALPRLPRPRRPRRRPRRAAGRALVGRGLRLLPHLQPRQRDRRAALGGGGAGPARPGRPDRRRRAGRARRVAARSGPPPRAQALARPDPGAGWVRGSQSSRCWAT